MAQYTWIVTVSYGCGGNMDIEVQAPNQTAAREIGARMTGYKAIRARRA
jgi:hypothetical protein